MQLNEDERAALNRYRTPAGNALDATTLALAVLRLFPVRTYGDLVIRWDDEITPERLVSCGWCYSGVNPALIVYNDTIVFHRWDKSWRVSSEWLSAFTKPRNMLDVWQLMGRCGIENNSK